jgi:hypothetical protein
MFGIEPSDVLGHMSDDKPADYAFPMWRPGAIRDAVITAAEKMAEYDIVTPPLPFYKAIADRAEEIANEAIAGAINARDDHTVIANIKIARCLLDGIGDEIFLATEQAGDYNAGPSCCVPLARRARRLQSRDLMRRLGCASRPGVGHELEDAPGHPRLDPCLSFQGLHEGRRAVPGRRVPRTE